MHYMCPVNQPSPVCQSVSQFLMVPSYPPAIKTVPNVLCISTDAAAGKLENHQENEQKHGEWNNHGMISDKNNKKCTLYIVQTEEYYVQKQ